MTGNDSTKKNSKPFESQRIFPLTRDDEIVISGISGRYPSCDNVDEFREHLFNKVGSQTSFSGAKKRHNHEIIRIEFKGGYGYRE